MEGEQVYMETFKVKAQYTQLALICSSANAHAIRKAFAQQVNY